MHGGGCAAAAPASAGHGSFWREGVVVSVKGPVGSLVFWVLGEKEGKKKWGGKCFFFPCSLRVQGEEEALWCRSKRHCLLFSLFFLVCNKTHETTLFGPKHAVYLNKNWRQNGSNFRLALQFARFFTMVLGFGFLQSSP
jgi:hypothetical protein